MPAMQTVHSQLITPLSVDQPESLRHVLIAIEQDPMLAPTHWGPTRGVREAYDRQTLLHVTANAPPQSMVPEIRRVAPICYVAHWYSGEHTLSAIHFEWHEGPNFCPSEFFESMARLAGAIPLDFGHIDIRYRDQSKDTFLSSGSHAHHLEAYRSQGLDHVFATNYFGPRLLGLMGDGDERNGARLLADSGGVVTRLINGVRRLDLVDRPWDADPQALKSRQRIVESCLRPTGIFARRVGQWRHEPGFKWERPG